MSVAEIAVLGLGEAGGRLAGDLAAAGAVVRGYDPDPARPARRAPPRRLSPAPMSC